MKKKCYRFSKLEIRIIIMLLFVLLFLTIGYSTFSTELGIRGVSAIVRAQKDIRIIGIVPVSSSSDGVSHWEEYNVSDVSSSISLPNSDSSLTYEVKVLNLGNVEVAISEISGLSSNLKYTLNNYNLSDQLCDDNDSDKCKLGSITTLSITISYAENGYDSNNTDYIIGMNFDFTYMMDVVAKIGDKFYDTLKDAISKVPTTGVETKVVLLNNTSESITIGSTKNVVLDLNGKTLSNNGNTNVIINKGTLKIYGGTIASDASTNGAINNEDNGNITISGGRIIVTGGRQALYNNKGTATITGSAYLESSSSERAAVQNQGTGTMYITGGKIVSTGLFGLNNAGVLSIGEKDGHVSTEYPIIQGVNYGINSTVDFNFYDGIVKSKLDPFNDILKIVDKEDGYGILNSSEMISNDRYKTAYLGISKEITFDPCGGITTEVLRYVETEHKIGKLPDVERMGYEFLGWYTSDGYKIDANYIVYDDKTFYAHWQEVDHVALIGDVPYDTLSDAILDVPLNNTETVIKLTTSVPETISIVAGQNIVLDLNGKTLSNDGNVAMITNNGTLTITNGTVRTSADQGAINNESGKLVIDGAQIISVGTRQAIYITGGEAEIRGDSYLESKADGKSKDSTIERGTVQVISGKLTVYSGTIICTSQQAISNEGTVIIGTKDGNINSSNPVIRGATYGVKSLGVVNFYDGVIMGKTDSINGNVSEIEDSSQIISGSENVNGVLYSTKHLEIE